MVGSASATETLLDAELIVEESLSLSELLVVFVSGSTEGASDIVITKLARTDRGLFARAAFMRLFWGCAVVCGSASRWCLCLVVSLGRLLRVLVRLLRVLALTLLMWLVVSVFWQHPWLGGS